MSFVKRMNYFTNEILNEDDFKTEQSYHKDLRQLHNSTLHSSGIGKGFGVELHNNELKISSGLAIDGKGKEIYLPEDYEDIQDVKGKMIYNSEITVYQSITDDTLITADGTYNTVYLTVFLDEVEEDLQSEGLDSPKPKKYIQEPKFKFFLDEPDYTGIEENDNFYVDKYLVLASVKLTLASNSWTCSDVASDIRVDIDSRKSVAVKIDGFTSEEFILTDTDKNSIFKISLGKDNFNNDSLEIKYIKDGADTLVFYVNKNKQYGNTYPS